ncbi:hypothetical protein BHM03_00014541 [Ensete ventricosum]|nr:hypothetical protein BHM03_00014541 [Ensete ventricosum]
MFYLVQKADIGGTEKIKEKECSVKIEVGTKDNIRKIDCLSWGSKPNMKRARICSATYGEASWSTDGANTRQEKAGYFCPEDDLEHKRMKHYREGHSTGSHRDQSMDGRSPFKVQPFANGYLHEQQQRYGVNYGIVMSESIRCTERSFFPVDSGPLRNNVVENFRYFISREDEASRESDDTPDLELSLGDLPSPFVAFDRKKQRAKAFRSVVCPREDSDPSAYMYHKVTTVGTIY